MTVNTFLIDMPTQVKGQTVKNDDGSYSVFLNTKLSHEQHLLTYAHELRHIEDGDFEKENVQDIEEQCHKND